jgi:FlgN protein
VTLKYKDNFSGVPVDSLMDLLVAQCSDLESLLRLARLETSIAEKNDFEELLAVIEKRGTLSDRLESYQRQIAELRSVLGRNAETMLEGPVAKETIRLALEIEAQDSQTATRLRSCRQSITTSLARLDHGQRNSVAYLRDAQRNGLNCDRRG